MYFYLLYKHIIAIVYIIDVFNIVFIINVRHKYFWDHVNYTTEVTKRLNNIKNKPFSNG